MRSVSEPRRSLQNLGLLFLMGCALILSGCAKDNVDGAAVEQRAQAVVTGTTVSSSADTSTAALRFWDAKKSKWDVACSGTYLRKDLVLTAAHCAVVNAEYSTPTKAQDLSLEPLAGVEVCAAQSNTADGTDCDWQTVEKMFVAPGYSGEDDHTHDWALVKLASEASEGNLRLSNLPSLMRTSLPEEVRIQSAQLDASFTEGRIVPSFGDFTGGPDIDESFLTFSGDVARAETGDSGSGWFSIDPDSTEWNQQTDVVAVHSAGNDSSKSKVAYATNVHFWLSTLNAFIALLDRENVACAVGRRYDTSGESAKLLAPDYTVCTSTDSGGGDGSLHYFDRAGDLIAAVPSGLDTPVEIRAFAIGALTPSGNDSIPDWDVVLAVVDGDNQFSLLNSEGDLIAETTLGDDLAPEGKSIDDVTITIDPMDLDIDGNVEYILGVGEEYTPFDQDLAELSVLGGEHPVMGLYRGYLNTDPMPDFLAIMSCSTGGQQGSRTRQLIAGNRYGIPPIAGCVSGMEENGFTDAIVHPQSEEQASLAKGSDVLRLGFIYMAGGDVACREISEDGYDFGDPGVTWNWLWNPSWDEPEAREIRAIRKLEGVIAGVEILLEDGRTVEVLLRTQSLGFCQGLTIGEPKVGWPSVQLNDGKLALLGNRNLNSIGDSSLSAYITVNSGERLEVDVYDPDFAGLNDRQTSEDTCFSLAQVPAPGIDETSIVCFSGAGGTTECEVEGLVEQISEKDILASEPSEKDHAWVPIFNYEAVDCGAGRDTCSFRFEASLLDGGCGGDLVLSSSESSFNGLKIRTNGALELGGQARIFMGADKTGDFASGDSLTFYPETNYDGIWDIMEFDVLGSGTSEVSLRQADADDMDSPDGFAANGANAEISYELLQLQSDGTLEECGAGGCVVDVVSGNYDGEVEDLAGEGLVAGINEHSFEVAAGETYVWRWSNVLTDNTVGVYTPTGSPLTHRAYARGSRRLSTGTNLSAGALAVADGAGWSLPVMLGEEKPGCGVVRGNAVVVDTAVRARAILSGGGDTNSDLLRELLAAKLNVVSANLQGLPLETARIDSSELLVQDVLEQAERAVSGTSSSDDAEPESLAMLLQYINDDLVSYIGLPTYEVGAGDPDGDGIVSGVDNCPSVANVDQQDLDQNNVGDACQPQPLVHCVHDLGDGRRAAVFGYSAHLKDYRYSIGRQNRFVELEDSQGQPTWLKKGTHDVVFSVEFDTPSLTWDLNGKIAVADASSPECSSWPAVKPDCCGDGQTAIVGDDTSNVFDSTDGGDYCLVGLGDDDELISGAGDDNIVAGAGDDFVDSGDGYDIVWGGAGNDVIRNGAGGTLEAYGGAGHDRIIGGPGDDAIYPGTGIDYVYAGEGDDIITITSACDVSPGSVFNGGPGVDVLYSVITLAQIEALGGTVLGVETLELTPSLDLPPSCWQEMFAEGALFGSSEVRLADRASVHDGSQLGAIAAGEYVELGVQAEAAVVSSGGDVFMRNDAFVSGDVDCGGAYTDQPNASVGGTIREGVALPFDSAEFDSWHPTFDGGANISLQNGASETLVPGSYEALSVSDISVASLSTGTYFFKSLSVEPNAMLSLDESAGPIVILVRDQLALKGEVVSGVAGTPRLFIAYLGVGSTTLTRSYSGRLFAPHGELILESSGGEFYGSFFGKTVTVRPDVSVFLEASIASDLPQSPTESCVDGIWNQDELAVDCGGSCESCDEVESPDECTVANAMDLGGPGQTFAVSNDGCVMVRDGYPSWWGQRLMQLQTTGGGSYDVPFTWSNACSGAAGSGLFTGPWQSQFFGPTDGDCATLIDLQGVGDADVSLLYY